jgi:Cofilin/tropomyosin-type actin-binding protein
VDELQENEAQYVYLRVEFTVDESIRVKFVLISWVGENTSPLKKGRVSVDKYARAHSQTLLYVLFLYYFLYTYLYHISIYFRPLTCITNRPVLKKVIKELTVEITASEKSELANDKIESKLRSANY